MNRIIKVAFALIGLVMAPGLHAITLVDKLDEPRGFCVDTVGFEIRAKPEEGLQTHSCYSYQGQLAVAQAFDTDLIPKEIFQIIAFNLRMTARAPSTGSAFALEPCNGRATQEFERRPNGKIVLLAAPGNCVTVCQGPSRHGGGNPVHLIRTLTLKLCESSSDNRQLWRLRAFAD